MNITKLPGTTIDVHIEYNCTDQIFTPMFYSGGLVLSQVAQITGLEGYIIQNWIKRKYISPPENKKYTRNQLCRIININILKFCFTLEQAEMILNYISNPLENENDSFDDSYLYSHFVNILVELRTDSHNESVHKNTDAVITNIISNKKNKLNLTQQRLCAVLKIMVTAYESMEIKNKAMRLYGSLDFR